MELLELDNVAFRYENGPPVLDGVSISVEVGEVVAVLGPSGCGKSTLLAMIAGLLEPTAGSVRWNEVAREEGSKHGSDLALMFQKDTVLPWRTVSKNVEFGLENMGLSKAERRQRSGELLSLGGLEHAAQQYPKALSGGMRRRLALLMALAVDPSVLLLDEPFSALDEPTRVGLHQHLLNLAYGRHTSVVLVTHDLSEAISLADRVYILGGNPARIVTVRCMPFGHDRNMYSIRTESKYSAEYEELWAMLWPRASEELMPEGGAAWECALG